MAIAFRQIGVAQSDSSVASFSITMGSSILAGSLLWMGTLIQAGDRNTRGTPSDGATGTWNWIGSAPEDDATDVYAIDQAYSANHPGSTTSVVYTPNGNSAGAVFCAEFTGADTTSPLDVFDTNLQASPGTGTDAVTSGPQTNTSQPTMVCGFGCAPQAFVTPSSGTGFTDGGVIFLQFGTNIGRFEYQRVTSLASRAATLTVGTNGRTLAAMAQFKEAAAGGGAKKRPGIRFGGALGNSTLRAA